MVTCECPREGCAPPTPVAATSGGGMALDCDMGASGIQETCSYTLGDTFSMQIHITGAPPGGFTAFLVMIIPDLLPSIVFDYLPTEDLANEMLWPECVPARSYHSPPSPLALFFWCRSPFYPDENETFVGPVLQFEFKCQQEGTTRVPLDGGFVAAPLMHGFDSSLAGAAVTCT